MAVSAAQIEKLCDDWCAATTTPGGGTAIGRDTEKHRLLANGVIFHELNFECLCAAITGTSKVLLRPGLNAFVSHDHFALWAWSAELVLCPCAQLFSRDQLELRGLVGTSCHAALVNCSRQTASPEEWEAQTQLFNLQPHHARYFVQNAHIALAYLGFPLLEMMTKRACSAFVDLAGNVISDFSVPRRTGGMKDYKVGKKVSSLRDLLHLQYSVVATPNLRSLISKLRVHLSELDGSQDPFDLVYAWRNDSLHGSASLQTIGGTLLNWSLLTVLAELEPAFEKHREIVLEHCRREAQSSHRSPWSFYRPYLS